MSDLRRFLIPFVAILILGTFGPACAEEDLVLDIFRSRVEIGVDGFPNRPFKEDPQPGPTIGEYGSRSAFVNANIPLGGVHVSSGRVLASQWFLGASYQYSSPDVTFLSNDRTLMNGGLYASALWLSKGHELYIASFGATFAEDDKTINNVQPRFFGTFLGTHRFTPKTTLLYGGSFSYVFGRGLPLPILGARWRLSDKWTLTGMLPFVIDARYRARDDIAIRIRLSPQGNQYRFSNQGEFPGQDDTLRLRINQPRLIGELEWKATRGFALIVQGGVTRARKFSILDTDNNDILAGTTASAGYARVAARFTFGKSLLDDWQP